MTDLHAARARLACWGLLAFSAIPLPAASADSDNSPTETLEEIDLSTLPALMVTAQKRNQSVQEVAISMAAYTEQQLQDLGVNTVVDLAQHTSNMHFTSFFGAGKPNISIRGISIGQLFTNFEQAPVGIYHDEVFVGARSGQLAQMFDQERIEVLRGPQGTLYGRNTTAGAINFIAKKPGERFEAEGSVNYGRFNEIDVEAGVTLPLSDTLSLRVAGIKRQREGWQTNIDPSAPPGQRESDDIDNWGTRALLQWKPKDGMTWLLNVHASGNDTHTPVLHADRGGTGLNAVNPLTGYLEGGRWDQISVNDPSKETIKAHGAALTATIDFRGMTLTSISAYEAIDYTEMDDGDGSPYRMAPISTRDSMSQYSQELRLAAKQGRLDWVAGLFYYHDDLTQRFRTESFTDPFFDTPAFAAANITGAILENFSAQTSRNYAGFGDVRYALAQRWTLDVGARYTHEEKQFSTAAFQSLPFLDVPRFQTIGFPGDALATAHPRWSALTGRLALEWTPLKDILAYGSVSHGFKSGGVNGFAFNSSVELAPYDPEEIDLYELGLKSAWLGGRVVANAAVFYNELKGIQALVGDVSNTIPLLFVRNAAGGTSRGAELELRAQLTKRWNVSLGLGLLNTRFTRFVLPDGTDYSGQEFTYAPKVTGNAQVQYLIHLFGGTLVPQATLSYVSHQWWENAHRPGLDETGGYAVVDTAIPWRTEDKRLELSVWCRNLTDKHYFLNVFGSGFNLYGAGESYHAAPRTYGVTARYSFK